MFDVTEFFGDGDPMFGGAADDRPLGKDGKFLTGCWHRDQVAKFTTKEEAQTAADRAPNRRKGGLIAVLKAVVR